MDHRFVEVPRLTLWTINRLNRLTEYYAGILGVKGKPVEYRKLKEPREEEVGIKKDKRGEDVLLD